MKFLSKNTDSAILSDGLVYKENSAENNRALLDRLKQEQKNFCAYTEKYLDNLDSCEVEHLNSAIKYDDNYFNYYAVIRKANQYKKDKEYKKHHPDRSFFGTKFFQSAEEFNRRIKFSNGIYEETDSNDIEAKEFIDFLGFNNDLLYNQRNRHVNRLKEYFEIAKYSKQDCIDYLSRHKNELSFITALEIELDIQLTQLI